MPKKFRRKEGTKWQVIVDGYQEIARVIFVVKQIIVSMFYFHQVIRRSTATEYLVQRVTQQLERMVKYIYVIIQQTGDSRYGKKNNNIKQTGHYSCRHEVIRQMKKDILK